MKERPHEMLALWFLALSLLIALAEFPQTGDILKSSAIGVNHGGTNLTISSKNHRKVVSMSMSDEDKPNQTETISQQGVSLPPQPRTLDPTILDAVESWNGSSWDIILNWNSTDQPFVLSTSPDPTFQNGVKVLGKDVAVTTYSKPADPDKILECFDVSGNSVLSAPDIGIGYTPDPDPSISSIIGEGHWWGDTVTIYGSYLDSYAKGNISYMYDLPVRATDVTLNLNGEYADSATFTIPDDARSFYALIEANSKSSQFGSYYPLYPRGIGPFGTIRGISYVTSGLNQGKVWIAADNSVEEIDIFLHDPIVTPGRIFSDVSMPYLSRVTTDDRILYVNGAGDKSEIYQIDTSSGARTHYAYTSDGGFNRNIAPVGIAVTPDGTACYIADAIQGKIVKIPIGAGPGTSTIVDNWGNRTFSFPDPCGMDVEPWNSYVIVADNNNWSYLISSRYSSNQQDFLGAIAHSIEVDRDYSVGGAICCYNWTEDNAIAEAFNRNDIGSNPPRYHGASLFGCANGNITVDPNWGFEFFWHYPQRVILSNQCPLVPYSSPHQSRDAVIKMEVVAWPAASNRSLNLIPIDPPDLSHYSPDNGCLQEGCAQMLPYEANDNVGIPSVQWSWGISHYETGYHPELESSAMGGVSCSGPDSSSYVGCSWLVTPHNNWGGYSGNNFQVEALKNNEGGNFFEKVASLSSVYTVWKRVFVERDKMFRKGGLLYAPDADHMVLPAGLSSLQIYKGPSNSQIDNLSEGDKIAIFDNQNPYEGPHDETYVCSIDRTTYTNYAIIDLVTERNGSIQYHTKYNYGASPVDATTYYPDFSQGLSAGIGVIESNDGTIYDTSLNQINGTGAAFYVADMEELQKTLDDANVEVYGLRDGMGAMPYVGGFGWPADSSQKAVALVNFSYLWFKNIASYNYLHLIGIDDAVPINPYALGVTPGINSTESGASYIYVQKIKDLYPVDSDKIAANRYCTIHEWTHNFSMLALTADTYHCDNMAWPIDGEVPTHKCIMNPVITELYETPPRFCIPHLFTGGSSICDVETSIRNQEDPLPY